MEEAPTDVTVLSKGLLLSSHCLERNVDKLFHLWTEVLAKGVHWESSAERLRTLIAMMATDAMNNVVHNGHSYAMASSAAALLPGANARERVSGFPCLALLNKLNADENITGVIDRLMEIASLLLRKDHMKIALNTTENSSESLCTATSNLLSQVPGDYDLSMEQSKPTAFDSSSSQIYYSSPFPVHFCSTSVLGVHYTSQDFSPLTVLAKLLSLKFLHTEIREKGGAYGSGAVTSSTGIFSFFSYRDPNFTQTIDTFERSWEWLERAEFSDRDVDEAKLGVFQKLDLPVLPGERGIREFLSGVTDEMVADRRNQVKSVTKDDLLRVGEKYLAGATLKSTTVIGPARTAELEKSWDVRDLV